MRIFSGRIKLGVSASVLNISIKFKRAETRERKWWAGVSYLLLEDDFLLAHDGEVVLKALKLGLLLQAALHGALPVLDQATIIKV